MARRRAIARRTTASSDASVASGKRSAYLLRWRWLLAGLGILLFAVVAGLYAFPRADRDDAARPIATLRTADFHALAFHPADPQVVFFGHHGGVMRSEDGGRTWRPLVARANFDGMGLAVDQTNPQTVYLAGHDILQVSGDAGVSWRPLSHNLPGTDIHGLAMSPADPARLYAFVVGHGMFRSTDRGTSWEPLGKLPPDVLSLTAAGGSPETLYAASARAGLLRSRDGGQSWEPAGRGVTDTVLTVAVDRGAPQATYAGTELGLYKSTDAGETWRALAIPSKNIVTLGVSAARPGLLMAIAVRDGDGLVFRSEDGGESWRSE